MTATHRIDANILAILSNCAVVGDNLALPPGQLDRKTYEAVNKALELMGGKWNRKLRVHVFAESPADLLDTVILTGEITDKKKLFQQFFTPNALADRVVDLANIGTHDRILEPSAGRGSLIAAIHRADRRNPEEVDGEIVAVEYDLEMFNRVTGHYPHIQAHHADFLTCSPERLGTFDRIVMNPPFTRGQDVKHILHATKFLRQPEEGSIVAICADGPRQHASLDHLVTSWESLPSGTFAESGTEVRTALIVIDL